MKYGKLSYTGDVGKTEQWLLRLQHQSRANAQQLLLERYARYGVDALIDNTPVDSGLAASSWSYEIRTSPPSIFWTNSNVENGANVAILIQYGHATRNGGFVQGRDYINPAVGPVMDELTEQLWKELTNL